MGTIFKKTFTKPVPLGAEIFERKGARFARWVDSKGKKRTALLTTGNDGTDRIAIESGTYTAKYRNGSGHVLEVATGCRDADAARAVLGDLERRSELIKAGVITAAEDSIADHQPTPLATHIADYMTYLRGRETSAVRMAGMEAQFRRVNAECEFKLLADLSEAKFTAWLLEQAAGKGRMSAATRNEYRKAFNGFCNWCLRTRRLSFNPLAHVPVANVKADPRRQRRALNEAELMRLLTVARWRPLADFGRERGKVDKEAALAADRKPKRSNWKYLTLTLEDIEAAVKRARISLKNRPEFIAKQERLGRERALIYKTLVLTGLRKGELASLTPAKLSLGEAMPYLILDAADEKNGTGSTIPLRPDLAADMQAWLDDQEKPTLRENGKTIPFARASKPAAKGAADKPLFTVPAGLVRILDRDLKAAGIAKRDERGRTVDVHALRHSFGTLLSKGGVSPRTAQAAMRHSDINLTMNTYTDPRLLDVAGAMDALPLLPLDGPGSQSEFVKATGTYDLMASPLAPTLALTPGKQVVVMSFPVNLMTHEPTYDHTTTIALSCYSVNGKDSLTLAVNESFKAGDEDRTHDINLGKVALYH